METWGWSYGTPNITTRTGMSRQRTWRLRCGRDGRATGGLKNITTSGVGYFRIGGDSSAISNPCSRSPSIRLFIVAHYSAGPLSSAISRPAVGMMSSMSVHIDH